MKATQLKQHLQARVSIQVLDRWGRTVEARERDCDLVLNNWLQWAGASSLPFFNLNNLSLVADDGSVQTYTIREWNFISFGYPGNAPKISIGSGTTPPSPGDFRLANELQRSGVLDPASWSNPQTGRFETVFFHTFATDTPITVSEVGFWDFSQKAAKDILLARDLIDPPLSVPAGGAVKVTYALTMAVVRG